MLCGHDTRQLIATFPKSPRTLKALHTGSAAQQQDDEYRNSTTLDHQQLHAVGKSLSQKPLVLFPSSFSSGSAKILQTGKFISSMKD